VQGVPRRIPSLLLIFALIITALLPYARPPLARAAEEPPISQGKPTTASSSYFTDGGPLLPEYANDGDPETSWVSYHLYGHPELSEFPEWWQVDLGQSTNIGKVVALWGDWFYADWAYQYTIGVSENGTNFTTVVDRTGNTTPGETTDTFSAQGRYVRITIVAGDSDPIPQPGIPLLHDLLPSAGAQEEYPYLHRNGVPLHTEGPTSPALRGCPKIRLQVHFLQALVMITAESG
jgi:hypothetical protein